MFASIIDNPIFVRELRRRMRGKAIIFSLVSYVILMAIISFSVIFLNVANRHLPPQEIGQKIGQGMFYGISIIQAFLVLLAAPSITSSMTTAEREKQTFEFLQATTLSARAFVVGNLLSTLMYVLIVLVCAMPVLSVTFLYGGISIDDVLTTFGILLAGSLLLTCFALLASSINTRTRSVQAVVTVVCVLVGLFMLTRGIIFAGFAASGGIPVFLTTKTIMGFKIPLWALAGIPFLAFCAMMIVAAGRRLYEPDNRLFNYRQYAVIFLFFSMLAMTGLPSTWLLVTLSMLYFGALNFSTGRPFLGDEIWVIKRRHPRLRRVDEGLFYMLGLLLFWAATAVFIDSRPNGFNKIGLSTWGTIAYGVSSTLMFYCLGRYVSQYAYTRHGAFVATFAIIVCFIGLPLLFPLFGANDLSLFTTLSPMGFVMANNAGWRSGSVAWACSLVMAAIAIGLAFGWSVASRKHRLSDYHFDLNWEAENGVQR